MFSVSKAKGADGTEERGNVMSFHKIVPVKETRKPAPAPKPRKREPKKHQSKRPIGHK